jgi:hypothetical protein
MKTQVFKHLFCNIDFSLYMFTNSKLQCHKSLSEICKTGKNGGRRGETTEDKQH